MKAFTMLTTPTLEQLEPRLLLDGAAGADSPAQDGVPETPAVFVRAEEDGFKLGDHPFYAPGTNNYYLLTYGASEETRKYIDEVLETAAEMNLKVIRAWAFCDGEDQWNALQTAPGEYSETVFCGLDYVIYRSGELGLRLILPFVNSLDDYGGMAQYVKWDAQYGTDPNQVATRHNDFYTDADTRQWYKDFVTAVLNRRNTYTGVLYKDDPTIFAWELANEPRATGDKSGDILQTWIEEMAAYVKSIDPNHMLTIGLEGLYNRRSRNWLYDGSEGTDFIRNHQVEGIDFATVHIYPDEWDIDTDQCLAWYKEHIDDARNKLHMPLILEEFALGVTASGPRDQRDKLYADLFELAKQTDSAGWNFWMLAHKNHNHGEYSIRFYDQRDASTVDIISAAAAEMNARSAGDGTPDTADARDQRPAALAGELVNKTEPPAAASAYTNFLRLLPWIIVPVAVTAAVFATAKRHRRAKPSPQTR